MLQKPLQSSCTEFRRPRTLYRCSEQRRLCFLSFFNSALANVSYTCGVVGQRLFQNTKKTTKETAQKFRFPRVIPYMHRTRSITRKRQPVTAVDFVYQPRRSNIWHLRHCSRTPTAHSLINQTVQVGQEPYLLPAAVARLKTNQMNWKKKREANAAKANIVISAYGIISCFE